MTFGFTGSKRVIDLSSTGELTGLSRKTEPRKFYQWDVDEEGNLSLRGQRFFTIYDTNGNPTCNYASYRLEGEDTVVAVETRYQ